MRSGAGRGIGKVGLPMMVLGATTWRSWWRATARFPAWPVWPVVTGWLESVDREQRCPWCRSGGASVTVVADVRPLQDALVCQVCGWVLYGRPGTRDEPRAVRRALALVRSRRDQVAGIRELTDMFLPRLHPASVRMPRIGSLWRGDP